MTTNALAALLRLASCALTVVVTAGVGLAQFGESGHPVAATASQQQALDKAKEFLEWTGEDLTGVTLTAADLKGNIPAASAGDGSVIGIDFDRLEHVVPPNTPGAPGYPGCVVVLIFHELQHTRHGWGRDFCSELGNTLYTATKHCEFVTWILSNGGGPTDALCLM